MSHFLFIETVAQDVRYAIRVLKFKPLFALSVMLLLALGIGVNTTLFSIVDALMLRTIPVPNSQDLFILRPEGPRAVPQLSYPQFSALRDEIGSGNIASMSRVARLFGTIDGQDRQLFGVQLVSGEYFSVLHLLPVQGRLFTANDNLRVGDHPVAVISDRLWRRMFGEARDVVGKVITLQNVPFTIIGIAPPEFAGLWLESPVDVWVPLMMQHNVKYAQNYYNNGGHPREPFVPQERIRWLDIIVRSESPTDSLRERLLIVFLRGLKEEALTIQSETERRLFGQQILTMQTLARGLSGLRGRFGPPLYVMLAMALFILVVSCANAANLLMARAEARRREIAIRLSLGGSRWRVVRQLLTEGGVLVAGATACSLVFAAWTSDVLVRLALGTTGPLPFEPKVNGLVLVFTLSLGALTILMFGLVPSFRVTNIALAAALRTSRIEGGSRLSVQRLLVALQVALSLGLLVGAGALVGTLRQFREVELGFTPGSVITVRINPRASAYGEDAFAQLYRNAIERVEHLPGVRTAAVAVCGLIVGCNSVSSLEIAGLAAGERIRVQENDVSPKYFATVGMALVGGRDFTERDGKQTPKVAVVNEAFAERYFPGRSALGAVIGDGRGKFEIVGVVANARVLRVQELPAPMVFFLLEQAGLAPASTLEIRMNGDVDANLIAARQAIESIGLPVERISPLSRQVELNLTQEILLARVGSYAAALVLVLSCFGLFGVMSYVVSRRAREIGIQLALGATWSRIALGVLRDVAVLVGLGIAMGIPTALGLAGLIGSVLVGVSKVGFIGVATACVLLVTASIAAGLIPAWRAAAVDPLVAIRSE